MSDLFASLPVGRVGIKICGITNLADADVCLREGATALGFNFYPGSKRFLVLEKERSWLEQVPVSVLRVAVVVNPSLEAALRLAQEPFLDAIQLHGDEPPAFCEAVRSATGKTVIKALRVENGASVAAVDDFADFPVLLDAYSANERGGTGETFDWHWLERLTHPAILLSGGLKPENVGAALRLTGVRYVDVASGVENNSREKSADKIRQFVSSVREFEVSALFTSRF